jgi:ligand-binding sensor domain-containing protein
VSFARHTLVVALLLLTADCATSGTAGAADDERASLGGPRGALIEDVVLVGGFGRVGALAATQTRLYVGGEGGVAIYDRLSMRWLMPAALPGPVRELLVDRLGRGVYAFANGWWLVSPNGAMVQSTLGTPPQRDDVAPSPDAQQILRETPGLQSLGALLTRDAQLRTWQMTALARAPERNQVWAGTDGGGVFDVDAAFVRSTQMPYGLRARGATALALAADGVWIAEEPDVFSGQDVGITFAAADLASWRWLTPARGGYAIVAMAVRGHDACLATTAGSFIVDLDARTPVTPRQDALVQVGDPMDARGTPDGCWVGGTAGLARLPWRADSAAQPTVARDGSPALSLASSGDTLWIGTLAGIRIRTGDGGTLSSATLPNVLRGPVRALALAGSGLAVATDRELWLTDGAARVGSARRVDVPLDRLGRIRRIVADERTLWLGGSRGAAALSLRDYRWRFLSPSGIGPAFSASLDRERDVRDVALAPGVAWLATAAGILRVARGADGMPR